MEENKALVRRAFDDVWNEGNLELVDVLFAATYISHDPGNPHQAPGSQGVKEYAAMARAEWPDLHFSVEEQIAEGDLVASRWTLRGTHQREVAGVAATGRQVTATGTSISRIATGRIAEDWIQWDKLGILQQIGAIPAPAPAAS
jgi:steroid delta-isomerase-like uncharacterized protein